jgi:hypothetical protein
MAAAAMFELEVTCNKMGIYRPILMKFSTQTEKGMPEFENFTRAEVYGHF